MKSGSGEPVCWVTFMDQLRVAEGEISSVYTYSSSIKVDGDHRVRPICALPTATYIQIQRRSWDFMVSRPSPSVTALIIIIIWLNMDLAT